MAKIFLRGLQVSGKELTIIPGILVTPKEQLLGRYLNEELR